MPTEIIYAVYSDLAYKAVCTGVIQQQIDGLQNNYIGVHHSFVLLRCAHKLLTNIICVFDYGSTFC